MSNVKSTSPDNVEFATAPTESDEAISNPAKRSLEKYCLESLSKHNFRIEETRDQGKHSVKVYNKSGQLAGTFKNVIEAHKTLC